MYKKMSNIYLVGFMGTGKTSVGREVARRQKRQFVDLDELIEFKQKRRISEIFSAEGEPYFRRLEKRALQEVVRENDFVVGCGGGIVMDPENIRVMKETGTVICLSAEPAVILQRTCGCSHRPLLNVADPRAQIELLMKLRAPYYARADRVIDTSRLSIGQVVERVIKAAAGKGEGKRRKPKAKPAKTRKK